MSRSNLSRRFSPLGYLLLAGIGLIAIVIAVNDFNPDNTALFRTDIILPPTPASSKDVPMLDNQDFQVPAGADLKSESFQNSLLEYVKTQYEKPWDITAFILRQLTPESEFDRGSLLFDQFVTSPTGKYRVEDGSVALMIGLPGTSTDGFVDSYVRQTIRPQNPVLTAEQALAKIRPPRGSLFTDPELLYHLGIRDNEVVVVPPGTEIPGTGGSGEFMDLQGSDEETNFEGSEKQESGGEQSLAPSDDGSITESTENSDPLPTKTTEDTTGNELIFDPAQQLSASILSAISSSDYTTALFEPLGAIENQEQKSATGTSEEQDSEPSEGSSFGPADLVACWSLDNTGYDGTGKGNTLTPKNSIDCTVPGKFGNACLFDGVNKYLEAAASSSLDTSNAITISTWIKPDSSTSEPIIEYGSPSDTGVHLWENPGGTLFGNLVPRSGGDFRISSPAISPGVWTHVAATYNGTTQTGVLYIDGREVARQTGGPGSLKTNLGILIGARTWQEKFFKGLIDEVHVWKTARTGSEILDEFRSTAALCPSRREFPLPGPVRIPPTQIQIPREYILAYKVDVFDPREIYNTLPQSSQTVGFGPGSAAEPRSCILGCAESAEPLPQCTVDEDCQAPYVCEQSACILPASFLPDQSQNLTVQGLGNGLLGTYKYSEIPCGGCVEFTRIDPTINFFWPNPPVSGGIGGYLVGWEGKLEAPVTGTYTIYYDVYRAGNAQSPGSFSVARWVTSPPGEVSTTANLTQGRYYNLSALIMMEWQISNDGKAKLSWSYPGQTKQIIPQRYLYTYDHLPPKIYSSVPDVTLREDQSLSLDSCSLEGTPSITSQWYKDGSPIAGATTCRYTVSRVQPSDDGSYYMVATNAFGSDTSNTARVTVETPPWGSGTGLQGTYFSSESLESEVFSRLDPVVDFNWGSGGAESSPGCLELCSRLPAPTKPCAFCRGTKPDHFSAAWSGEIEVPYNDQYTFYVKSDDGARLWIDRKLVIDNWHSPFTTGSAKSAAIPLVAGKRYEILLEYYENTGTAQVKLEFSSPSILRRVIPTTQLYPLPYRDPLQNVEKHETVYINAVTGKIMDRISAVRD